MKKSFPWLGYLLIPLLPIIMILLVIKLIIGIFTQVVADILNKEPPKWIGEFGFYDY